MKNFLRPYIPSSIRKIYRKYKPKSVSEKEHDKTITRLKENYLKLNKDIPKDQMVFRKGMKMFVHPDSKFGFEHFCFISTEMVEEMDFFIEETFEKKQLLDIGALHGIFSIVFALNNPLKKALAVDASSLAFEKLLYNIHENNLQNIIPAKCAISDEPGKLLMHYEWEHAVSCNTQKDGNTGFEVDMKTGDSLCSEFGFTPDVIKIDVEGHEVKVLNGLAGVIKKLKPVIFLEIHPDSIKQEGDEIADIFPVLNQVGYNAFLPGNISISKEEICNAKKIIRILLKPV